jgi:hypothetical protein
LTELLFWYTHGVYCNKPSNFKRVFSKHRFYIVPPGSSVRRSFVLSTLLPPKPGTLLPSYLGSGSHLSAFRTFAFFPLSSHHQPSTVIQFLQISHPFIIPLTTTHQNFLSEFIQVHSIWLIPLIAQSKSVKNRFERWLSNTTPEPGLPIPPKDLIVNRLARILHKDLVLNSLPPYLLTHTFSTSPVLRLAM